MTAIDVASWLRALGVEEYAQAFAANDIDAEALLLLTDEDLQTLGVASLGHRKKILAAIAKLSQPPSPGEPKYESALTGERRNVTILFCDMVNFTGLTSGRDAEEVHVLLNRYFETVDSMVQLYGGYIDKHIGDAVMAVFGAPIAHTNDPERAVRAAFEIRRAVSTLTPRIQVHLGIASGSVVASRTGSSAHREYTMTGNAVNLASRLQDIAEAGEILVSESVHSQAASWVEATPLDDIELKGIGAPQRVWRLDRLRRTPSPSAGIFVGRDSELSELAGLISRCRDRGTAVLVHVRGEAGIGKSRLIEEFCRLAEAQGFDYHMGLTLDFGDSVGAIAGLCTSLLGLSLSQQHAEQILALTGAVKEGLIAPEDELYLRKLLRLPLTSEMRARSEATSHDSQLTGSRQCVATLLATLARRRPLLVIIEDIHWADDDELGYIDHMARTITDAPLCLVVTSRVHGQGDRLAKRASSYAMEQVTMHLAPLATDEAETLARSVLRSSKRLARWCAVRSGGHPLFLQQILQNAERTPLMSLPDSLQSLVQARIDTLEQRDKEALMAASVMGQRFSLPALRALIDDPAYECSRLIEHQLIRPLGPVGPVGAVGNEDEADSGNSGDYLFAHALILDGVYAALLKARRRALHRKAAAYFESKDLLVLAAEHLDRAEEASAAAVYLRAATAQCAEYGFERALQLAERGLAVVLKHQASGPGKDAYDQHGAIAYELTWFCASVMAKLGRAHDSIAAYRRALDLADTDVARCRAWLGMAQSMRVVDRIDEALALLGQAQPLAEAHGALSELAAIHHLRGNLLFPRGDMDGCRAEHERSLAYARQVGSPEAEARALSGLGDATYMRGQILTAYDYFCRSVALCRAHGLGSVEVANLAMRGVTRYYQNDLHGALSDGLEAVRVAAQVGDRRAELTARIGCLGFTLADMGRTDEAVQALEIAVERARSLGAKRFEAIALATVGAVLAAAGKIAEARPVIERSLPMCAETGMAFSAHIALSALAIATETPAESMDILHRGEEILAEHTVSHNILHFYRHAIDTALQVGKVDAALRYADSLEHFTSTEPLPWSRFFVARGRALARHAAGEDSEALARELSMLCEEADAAGHVHAAHALRRSLAEAKLRMA